MSDRMRRLLLALRAAHRPCPLHRPGRRGPTDRLATAAEREATDPAIADLVRRVDAERAARRVDRT